MFDTFILTIYICFDENIKMLFLPLIGYAMRMGDPHAIKPAKSREHFLRRVNNLRLTNLHSLRALSLTMLVYLGIPCIWNNTISG